MEFSLLSIVSLARWIYGVPKKRLCAACYDDGSMKRFGWQKATPSLAKATKARCQHAYVTSCVPGHG